MAKPVDDLALRAVAARSFGVSMTIERCTNDRDTGGIEAWRCREHRGKTANQQGSTDQQNQRERGFQNDQRTAETMSRAAGSSAAAALLQRVAGIGAERTEHW